MASSSQRRQIRSRKKQITALNNSEREPDEAAKFLKRLDDTAKADRNRERKRKILEADRERRTNGTTQ